MGHQIQLMLRQCLEPWTKRDRQPSPCGSGTSDAQTFFQLTSHVTSMPHPIPRFIRSYRHLSSQSQAARNPILKNNFLTISFMMVQFGDVRSSVVWLLSLGFEFRLDHAHFLSQWDSA
ncbi:hypothetical protein N656DRAFT_179297 [Canariomyces notabilis]|uniref:Uncharacterized protein n=1 Tax=Canariomyces notabilis TaxID=2074819 RepID=A0AAN6TBE7_9PEZI|nr:hypothetical protein N656DRAFT_179297 [Canariomyces arenarius]